jgi:hypothetical protein
MFGPKYDGVIEAVHYTPDGQVEWVRAYERRGAAFSDCVILDRAKLIERLKARKRFMVGRRIPQMAATFDTSVPVRLIREKGQEILVTGYIKQNQDYLEGVPII